MVVECEVYQAHVYPSHDALPDELNNHELKMRACLEGKGLLRTRVP